MITTGYYFESKDIAKTINCIARFTFQTGYGDFNDVWLFSEKNMDCLVVVGCNGDKCKSTRYPLSSLVDTYNGVKPGSNLELKSFKGPNERIHKT